VLLLGEMGGGKTTFTRGVLEGLGHPDPWEVASPTYALHHRYLDARVPVDHLDLYRTEGGPELLVQGLLDPLEDPESVCLVEWAERLGRDRPPTCLALTFVHLGENRRLLDVSVHGRGAAHLLSWFRTPAWMRSRSRESEGDGPGEKD